MISEGSLKAIQDAAQRVKENLEKKSRLQIVKTPGGSICSICKQPIEDQTAATNGTHYVHARCFVASLDELMESAETKYGFSKEHDQVLDLCIAQFGTCEFNCAKDGAPNCYYHVARRECSPSNAANIDGG